MNPTILYRFLELPECEEKDNIRNKLVEYYLEEAIIDIRMFLKSINYRHNDALDYLDVYLKSFDRALRTYDKGKSSFLTYMKTLLLFELYREIENEVRVNAPLYSAISLSSLYEGTEECVLINLIADDEGSNPIKYFERNEMKLVLSDSLASDETVYTPKQYAKAELQRKILIFRYYGYTLEEIAKFLKTNVYKLRYTLRDDSEETPLGKIKIIFGDEK